MTPAPARPTPTRPTPARPTPARPTPARPAAANVGRRRFRFPTRAGAALLLGLSAAGAGVGAGGCAIFGVAIAKFSGPTHHPPAYALSPAPVLVYVDRRTNYGSVATDAQRIAQVASDLMRTAKSSAPSAGDGRLAVVDPGRAVEARNRTGPDGRRLAPAEVAAACGAAQFVYVEITTYDYTPAVAGATTEGRLEARVWVVDAASGAVRWPPESNQGYAVSANLPATPLAGAADDAGLRGRMDDEVGQKVGRLFTGWTEE